MKILVLGSCGSMGKRYTAICKWLGHEVVEYDTAMGNFPSSIYTGIDKAIVATPTASHTVDCYYLLRHKIPLLCEKPICTYPTNIQTLIELSTGRSVDVRMVCNYLFTTHHLKPIPNATEIVYENYHTGKDGLWWDLIQLVYLSKSPEHIKINTENPVFECAFKVGNDIEYIGLDQIAESYVKMVATWLESPEKLWSLEDGLKATEKVIEYKKYFEEKETQCS